MHSNAFKDAQCTAVHSKWRMSTRFDLKSFQKQPLHHGDQYSLTTKWKKVNETNMTSTRRACTVSIRQSVIITNKPVYGHTNMRNLEGHRRTSKDTQIKLPGRWNAPRDGPNWKDEKGRVTIQTQTPSLSTRIAYAERHWGQSLDCRWSQTFHHPLAFQQTQRPQTTKGRKHAK